MADENTPLDSAPAPDTQAPDTGSATTQETTGGGFDAISSRLDELGKQIGELRSQPEPEWDAPISDLGYEQQQPGFDPYQQQGFDPNQQGYQPQPGEYQPGQYAPDQYMDPQAQQQQAVQQLQGYIQQQVQQGVQQQITPYIQQQKANELERKYPDLANPEKAAEVVKATAQWAQRVGKPELARDPEMVELVFLAQQARERAAQETPANGDQGVHLESGGAAPQPQEMDAGDRILQAFGMNPDTAFGG